MINVVCVNQGNYLGCGKQYVETLYDMVFRNTTREFRFICFTDDKEPYDPGIEKRAIPDNLNGWWAKLYMFSQPFEGQVLGYYKFDIFGMDSSFSEKSHHVYEQKLNDHDLRFPVWAAGKEYICAPWMYRQALNFQDCYKVMVDQGCRINVHGEGLIPDMCNYFKKEEIC